MQRNWATKGQFLVPYLALDNLKSIKKSFILCPGVPIGNLMISSDGINITVPSLGPVFYADPVLEIFGNGDPDPDPG